MHPGALDLCLSMKGVSLYSQCLNALRAPQWALSALPEAARERYERRGKRWRVEERPVQGDRVRR